MANFNFNKVILGGRLTADIELKTTPSGVSVCSFSLAVNRKVGKDQEPKTDFINCQAWRTTAEFLARYFKKGSSLCIVGNLQKREWEDKDGNKRSSTEVVVDEAMFVDSKSEGPSVADEFVAPAFKGGADAHWEEMKADDDLPF